jgi:four helix bundle protein
VDRVSLKIKSYKDLEVWKKGIDIVDLVYAVTIRFPSSEKFGLASQMRRAAVSIPSNVAEGYARQHRKEYQQFCSVALGSCSELETQTIITQRRSYASSAELNQLEELLDHESRMLMSLIKKLKVLS